MTLVAVALIAGAATAAAWVAARDAFGSPVLARRNYRGVDVPVGAGVLLLVGVIAVGAAAALVGAVDRPLEPAALASLVIALAVAGGFGLLGLFDDLAATGDVRGFRGHLGSLARGSLSTGAVKLVGGGLLALALAGALGADDLLSLAVGGALIALSANVGNLFDRAPGRTTKVALGAALLVLLATPTDERLALAGMVAIVAAGVGLLGFDLREELMLGDAGSNVLGAAIGAGIVATTAVGAQLVVLVVVLALNVASERISFSRVIDGSPPLRALDRLGRRPNER